MPPASSAPTGSAGARQGRDRGDDGARRAAPPKQGVDFSGTNVQEEGVDEPDLVKTDGNTLFAVANGKLNAVDVRDPKPRLLDSLALDAGTNHELLLHGDRLMVLSRGGYWIEPLPAIAARMAPFQPAQSALSEIDVSDPKRLRPVRTLTLDGSYVAARLVGGSVRIVTSAQVPSKLPFVQPTTGTKEALAATTKQQPRRRRLVARAQLAAVLPDQASRREGRAGAPARPVPPRAPLARVLRPRHAHRAHGRPREGPRAGRLRRGDDGRPDRLRLAREPLRRHRALGRPARSRQADDGARTASAPRSTSSTSRARCGRSTAAAATSPATCSASGRSPSTRASCASSAPRARRGGAAPARPSPSRS